jgi:hypothetical protein
MPLALCSATHIDVKVKIQDATPLATKEKPNDVDVVLVMDDGFCLEDCPMESRGLFDHAVAQARYGASVFWLRPRMLIGDSVEDFIAYWQTKGDRTQRGIVEVVT